ncbi:MAG: flavin reductase [Tidjanibacter sp.]|nr:flavin reductase [Tidjanibacter sp.]MBR4064295.1 flavin reductase [Tidjanibacter sp.]
MKKLFIICAAVAMCSCGGGAQKPAEAEAEPTAKVDVSGKSFDELFTEVAPAEFDQNIFKLVNQDYTVITAGTIPAHNSMIASWGGYGILFNKPASWCFLRANRYTLTKMRETQTYTLCYFPEAYKPEIMPFGTSSGRDSNKMEQTTLTPVATPDGLPAWKEAAVIFECTLSAVTTIDKNDFYTEEGQTFVQEGFDDAKDWHKFVFGEITHLWVAK